MFIVRGWYEKKYSPSAPFIRIEVARIDKKVSTQFEAFIDPGSDGTALPMRICVELNIFEFPVEIVSVISPGELSEERVLYAALLRFSCLKNFLWVKVDCRDDIEEIILGRDILNEFRLILDAKKEEVLIEEV